MDKIHKVPLTKVLAVTDHPNADRLSLVTVYGFQVIMGKGLLKVGDSVIYIPIDSILPAEVEAKIFGQDSKIRLEKSRVRQIKIRGLASQGLLATPQQLDLNSKALKQEQDLSELLGITKYEPPVKTVQLKSGDTKIKKRSEHPDFKTYNGLTNIKWIPTIFEGKEIVVQEKLHGTNARCGLLPYRADTLLKKIKKFLGLTPDFEFVYGSNQVDITSSTSYKGFYNDDIYGKVFQKINARLKLEPNEIIFGEIIGPGIQKGYDYGLNEHTFVLFDVMKDGKYLDPDAVADYAAERGFKMVPVLFKGLYSPAVALLTSGPSVFCPLEPVREGIVLKLRYGYDNMGSKTAAKWINEDYLANKNNTDFN